MALDCDPLGMSTKGVSVVAFANPNLRRGTFKPVVELLGEIRIQFGYNCFCGRPD